MEAICEHFQYVSEQIHIISSHEKIHDLLVGTQVVKGDAEQVQTEITELAQIVLNRPNDALHNGVEFVLGHTVELLEVVFNKRFDEVEECLTDIWVAVKIHSNHCQC